MLPTPPPITGERGMFCSDTHPGASCFLFYFAGIINYLQKICMKPHIQLYTSCDTSNLILTVNVGHR